MPYVFTDQDSAFARRDDGADIPWDKVNNRPADIDGHAGRRWQLEGSPVPAPYVAPPPTEGELRNAAFDADVDRQNMVSAITNATPAQIKNYVNNNVTDLASARLMITRLTLLVAKSLRT
jgi:hypothetical protein